MEAKLFALFGWGCMAFSIIGFIETALGFLINKTYNLLRCIIYSVIFGIAMGCLR